ncbi:MAG: prolipoprotein diacylglyceryl transferase [Oscillospiraceae bacterium]
MSLLLQTGVKLAGSLTTLAETVSDDKQDEILSNPDKVYFPFFGKGDNIFKNGFSLDNVLFTIPGTDFKIYWYGFLIAVGILLALLYGYRRMKSYGIDPDRATDAVIGGVVGAILGARLYYILFNDEVGIKDFFRIRDGGLAIYGGLIGAVLVGGGIAKLRGLKLTALLDVVGPAFLIGQAVGRWGNFFNQEAFGSNTSLPWGMMSNRTITYLSDVHDSLLGSSDIDVDKFMPVHPCFLYESLWCILGFVLINFYSKHRKFDGELFLMYIGWYGLGRFFIEGLRTDSLYLFNIRISQLIAGTCVIAALILILVFRGIVRRSGEYEFFYQTETSKQQLSQYTEYEQTQSEKAALKKKIRDTKKTGQPTAALEAEYDEKFGKAARIAARNKKLAAEIIPIDEDITEPALGTDDTDEDDAKAPESAAADAADETKAADGTASEKPDNENE